MMRRKVAQLGQRRRALRMRRQRSNPNEELYKKNSKDDSSSDEYHSSSGDDAHGSNSESSDQELRSGYRKGGYHPAKVGDRYADGRYIIEAKLGWGHFSTVWLATDTRVNDKHPNKLVAIKISKSSKGYTEAAMDEAKILSEMAEQDEKGEQYVVRLLDRFTVFGPNGKHVALVFETMGRNLLFLIKKYNYRGIPLHACKRIAQQVLSACAFMHDKCKVLHTDIKPENFLIKPPKRLNLQEVQRERLFFDEAVRSSRAASCKSFAEMSASELKDKVDEVQALLSKGGSKNQKKKWKAKMKKLTALLEQRKSEGHQETKEQNSSADGSQEEQRPEQTSKESKSQRGQRVRCSKFDAHMYDGNDFLEDLVVKMADFGNGCWVDKHFTDDVATRQYRSPECIIGADYGPGLDIWSSACMIFELVTGEYLFDPKACKKGRYSRDEDHLALITEVVGRLPKHLVSNGKYSHEFFSKGDLRNISKLETSPIDQLLQSSYGLCRKEAASLGDFLSRMLRPDPKRRATAAEMLEHPWLQEPPFEPESDEQKDQESNSSDSQSYSPPSTPVTEPAPSQT